jgi:hypothetical protein
MQTYAGVEESSDSEAESVSDQNPVSIHSSDSESDIMDTMADVINDHYRLVTGTHIVNYLLSKSVRLIFLHFFLFTY